MDTAVRDQPEQMCPFATRERGLQDWAFEERAVLDRLVHAHEVLEQDPAGADRQVAYLRVAHLPGRQADCLPRRVERRVRVRAPEPVEVRRVCKLHGVPGTGRRTTP